MENKYTAIIIEPRKHNALEFVLNNFLENLDDNWNIIIYHGNKNVEFVNTIIDTKLKKYKKRISLINLKVDNLSISDYNNLMMSEKFITDIPSEMFLIFQTDTMICEEHKHLIYNYMNYDYVGSPWSIDYLSPVSNINNDKLSLSSKYVGNGGLSLRRKSKMIEIAKKCKASSINEDEYFSYGCNGININKPSLEDAMKFSIETVYSNKSFGIHKAWEYVNVKESQCKNYNKLVKLNKKSIGTLVIITLLIIMIIIYLVIKIKNN
jgi:hypothetical protein